MAKRDLSIGEIAAIVGVASRTVTKWFDSGELPGYRLPGSNHRRVQSAEFLAFARKHKLPIDLDHVSDDADWSETV